MKLWPYKIMKRNDDEIRADLQSILRYFESNDSDFDVVVFVPNAGLYLSRLFRQITEDNVEIGFVTVRRASTVARDNLIKRFIFKRRRLSNLFRHLEVLARLFKHKIGLNQKMVGDMMADFDIANKKVLVIDDSVDTGTTMAMIKKMLLENGARDVKTACITNHLMPDKVEVDYAVYRYVLLRTFNSRDYYAM